MTKNPTDTNQASEDELQESVDALLERWRKILTHKGDGNGDEYYQSEVVADIQEIIRTEMLKLLAEVRERVVGGRLDLETFAPALEVKPDLETAVWVMGKDRHNELIDKQLAELTKLEAEQ